MTTALSTDRFVAEMCRKSYYQFFREFWHLQAAETLRDAWYIKKLCDELQDISERVFRDEPKEHDLIWNCPPGTTKSTAVSILWQPWIWSRMPSARVITGSYREQLSLDFARKSRDIVLSDKYRRLFPEIELRDDQNAKHHFENTRGGMRYACGVGGAVLGKHAHFIAIDDPIDPQGALSDLVLAEANYWMTEVISRRKVNLMLTPTVLIMQRLHQNDPTGNAIHRGVRARQCSIPCDLSWDVSPPEWRSYYQDGLLDPVRLSRAALDNTLTELGEAGYACQYGQSPIPRGGALFKVDQLSYADKLPSRFIRGPIRYWDKASTSGGGAFTVGAKCAIETIDRTVDRLWILDIIRDQWDSGTRERQILKAGKQDGFACKVWVEQEPAGSGKEAAEATVLRLTKAGLRCQAHKPTGDKELRADPLSQWVNMGRVVLLKAQWNRVFVEEMRYFPRSTYKDQIDAASGAFSRLTSKRLMIGAL